MRQNKDAPGAKSSDAEAMARYWRKVSAIMAGAEGMREGGEAYLPRFKNETADNYELRRKSAKFTNVFRDIVENLAQRPFSKEVVIEDGAPTEIVDFIEDVDARGNNLHVFAGEVFFSAIANAVDWILVDYTKGVPASATVAQERAAGARPYWCRYPAASVLAAYSAMTDGREEFVHVRLAEPVTVRDGWGEVTRERVRVLNREPLDGGGYAPATYEVWEQVADNLTGEEWQLVEGPAPVGIGIIPFVPFVTGRRIGTSWRLHPPMRDAADLQIELYQQESALKYAKTMTAFPMLAANGVNPDIGEDGAPRMVPVGPAAVLYAPPNGDGQSTGAWSFIEPSASSLRFLADDIKETIAQLRELGRQPLTAQSGNLTVVTTAFAAQKGNAAIQAWALGLKDALERALDITAMWLRIAYEPNVIVHTDFDLGMGDDDSFNHVMSLRGAGEISRESAIHEAKRRGILDAAYDPDEDLSAILRDVEGDDEPPVRLAAE